MNDSGWIQLRERRDFSEVLSATFTFLRQNFVFLAKQILFLVGPVVLTALIVGALSYLWLDPFVNLESDPFAVVVGFFTPLYLLLIIASYLFSATLFGFLVLYVERGPRGFDTPDLLRMILKYVWRLLLGAIVVAVVTIAGFIFFIIPGIYVAVATSLFAIVLMQEDLGVFEAIARCFELIRRNWWATFGIMFVLGILTYLISLAMMLPLSLFGAIVEMNTVTGEAEFSPLAMTVWIGVNTVLGYIGYTLIYLGLGIQYYNLVEQREMAGLLERVERIGTDAESEREDDGTGDR